MYNILQSAKSIKNAEGCKYDNTYGLDVSFPINGNVEGWDIYSDIYLYGSWNKVLFGSSKSVSCFIGRTINIAPITADEHYIFKLLMKLTDPGNLYKEFPTQGKIQWTTNTDNVWDSNKSVVFDLVNSNNWNLYTINLAELQFWNGTITNLRIIPFLDGYADIQFAIKSIRIESTSVFKCKNTQCSYYTKYVHPCQGVGSFSSITAGSGSAHYSTVAGVNDNLLVNIDNYGYESINLGDNTNITGHEMAKLISHKLNAIDIGGYSYAYAEHTEDNKLQIHSGDLGLADDKGLIESDVPYTLYVRAYTLLKTTDYFTVLNLTISNPLPYLYTISGELNDILNLLFVNAYSLPLQSIAASLMYKQIFVDVKDLRFSTLMNFSQIKVNDTAGATGLTCSTFIDLDSRSDIGIVVSVKNYTSSTTWLKDITNNSTITNIVNTDSFVLNPLNFFIKDTAAIEFYLNYGQSRFLIAAPVVTDISFGLCQEQLSYSETILEITNTYISTIYPYSGFFSPTTISIKGTAVENLGFLNNNYTYSSKPATGFEPKSAYKLRAYEIERLIDNEKALIAYTTSLTQYSVEAGRKDYFESITANSIAKSSSPDFYKKLDGSNKIIIDVSHPIDNCGRINNVKVCGKKYIELIPSILIFRPFKDGSLIKLYELFFDVEDSNSVYTKEDSTYYIKCNCLVAKGDVIGFKNFGIICLHSSNTLLPNATLYCIDASINIDIRFNPGNLFSQGVIGSTYYAYSDRIRDSLNLDIDIGKRVNLNSIEFYGKAFGDTFEYNVAMCLDTTWECSTYGNTHTHTATQGDRSYTFTHNNIAYGIESLSDGVVTVDGGKQGDIYGSNADGLFTSGNHSYFYVNGDAEWLSGVGSKYEFPYPWESVRVFDFVYDPIALYMIFPDNKPINIYKSTIYFKESKNFKHMSLSYYLGANGPEGNAEDLQYEYIKEFNYVRLDGITYYPKTEEYTYTTIQDYIFPNPMAFPKLTYVNGEATNYELWQIANNVEFNVIEREFDPVNCYGFKVYCDWHESTKIVEMELYSFFKIEPSLLGNFEVQVSDYGEVWEDLCFNKDILDSTKVYAYIKGTPRYLKIELTPQAELELYEFRLTLTDEELKLLNCDKTVLITDAPKGKVTAIQTVTVENTYDNILNLFVDIPKQLISSSDIIYWNKFDSLTSATYAEIGPGAIVEKNEDFPIVLYRSQIAINCHSYYLNNLIDNKKAYVFEKNTYWKEHSILTHDNLINYNNDADIFEASFTFNTTSSKYWKLSLADLIYHNLYSASLYYNNTLIPVKQLYVQGHTKELGLTKIPINLNYLGILDYSILVEDHFNNNNFLDYWQYNIPGGNTLVEDDCGLHPVILLPLTNSSLEKLLPHSANSFELEYIINIAIDNIPFVDLTVTTYAIGNVQPSYPGAAYDRNLIDWGADHAWYSIMGTTGKIGQHFTIPTLINEYRMYPINHVDLQSTNPKNWTFEGSHNNVDWIILDTQINQSFIFNDWQLYHFNNNISFNYYRLNVSANNGHVSHVALQELAMAYTESKSFDDFKHTVALKDSFDVSLLIIDTILDIDLVTIKMYTPNIDKTNEPTVAYQIDNFYFSISNSLEYINSIGSKLKIIVRKRYVYIDEILITNLDGSVILYSSINRYTYFLSRVSKAGITYSNLNTINSLTNINVSTEYFSFKALPILSNYETLIFELEPASPVDEIRVITDNDKVHFMSVFISSTGSNDFSLWARNYYKASSSIVNEACFVSSWYVNSNFAQYLNPWKALSYDGATLLNSWASAQIATDHWYVYDFGSGNEKIINQIYCSFGTSSVIYTGKVLIYGSNDSTLDWALKTKTFLAEELVTYYYKSHDLFIILNNNNYYRYYCLYFPLEGRLPTNTSQACINFLTLYEELTSHYQTLTAITNGTQSYYNIIDGQLSSEYGLGLSMNNYLAIDLGEISQVNGLTFGINNVSFLNSLKNYCLLTYSINSTNGIDGDWATLVDLSALNNNMKYSYWWTDTLYFNNTLARWVKLNSNSVTQIFLLEFDLIIGANLSPIHFSTSTYNNYFAVDFGAVHTLDFLRNYGSASTKINLSNVLLEFSNTETEDPKLVIWNSTKSEARWVRMPLICGDGIVRSIQYLGIYPDTSFAYRKYGGYNCEWKSIDDLLTRYNTSYNLASSASIIEQTYEGNLVKSVIFDISDNYGGGGISIKAIDFYNELSELIELNTTNFNAYATSYTTYYYPTNAFITALTKTGDWSANWYTLADSNQRLICVFNVPKYISSIVVNNGHVVGSATEYGAKFVRVFVSSDTITDTTYGAYITNSTLIFDGRFRQHVSAAIIDNQTIVTNIMDNTYNPYYLDWAPNNCISGDSSLVGFENCWGFKAPNGNTAEFILDLGESKYVDKFNIVHCYNDNDTSTWLNSHYTIYTKENLDDFFSPTVVVDDNTEGSRIHLLPEVLHTRYIKLEIIGCVKPTVPLSIYNAATDTSTQVDGGFVREFEVWLDKHTEFVNSEQHPVICTNLKTLYNISGHNLVSTDDSATWDNDELFFKYSDNNFNDPHKVSFMESNGLSTVFAYSSTLYNTSLTETSTVLIESLYLSTGYYTLEWESYGAIRSKALFISIVGSSTTSIFTEQVASDWIKQSGSFSIDDSGYCLITFNKAIDDVLRCGLRNFSIKRNILNSKWILVKRNTATEYSWDNNVSNYGIDYLNTLKVYASEQYLPTEVPWWWSSTISTLSSDYVNTKVGRSALKINYPTSSGVDRLNFIEGDCFGWDENWSIKDSLSFWLYISDLNNLYISDGGFGFGSFSGGPTEEFTDSLGNVKILTPKVAIYLWDFKDMDLHSGWNYINLQFDKHSLTDPLLPINDILKEELNFRKSYFTSFGMVYRGIGKAFYMLLDDLRIKRNWFDDSIDVNRKGLCLTWKEYASIPLGGLNLRCGSIELLIKLYTDTGGMDSFGETRSRSIFTVTNNNNELLALSLRSSGWFEIGFGSARHDYNILLTDPNVYDLSTVSFKKDSVVHVAVVWSNSGKSMSNNDTLRLYINNMLVTSSKTTWSVNDSKSSLLRLGGGGTIVANNNDAEGSAIFSDIKVYSYCKDSFNIDNITSKELSNINSNALLQLSIDGLNFYDINSGKLPLKFSEIPPGGKATIYTMVDKNNIDLVDKKTGTIDIEWEVIV